MGREWKIGEPKTVEPPPGYRLLGRDDIVDYGDILIARDVNNCDLWRAVDGDKYGTTVGYLVDAYHIAAFARKIDTNPVVQSNEAPSSKAKSDVVGVGLVLIPWYSILAIGKIFIEGLRYGRDNWKNGVGDKVYQEERLEHAMLHLLKWKEGDRTEAHLAKVAWFCVTQLELERLEKEKAK